MSTGHIGTYWRLRDTRNALEVAPMKENVARPLRPTRRVSRLNLGAIAAVRNAARVWATMSGQPVTRVVRRSSPRPVGCLRKPLNTIGFHRPSITAIAVSIGQAASSHIASSPRSAFFLQRAPAASGVILACLDPRGSRSMGRLTKS